MVFVCLTCLCVWYMWCLYVVCACVVWVQDVEARTATSKAAEMQTPQNMKLWSSETLAAPQKGPSRELVKHAVGGLAWQEAQVRPE